MSETLLSRLLKLSSVDASILRLISERKKLQSEFEALNKLIESLKKEVSELQSKSAKDKAKYESETARVKSERDGLAARRRALATLGNYKLQQAAAKEIDAAEKALSEHEDTLVNLLDSSEKSEKIATEKELLLLDKEDARAELVKDMKPTLENIAERESRLISEREEIAKEVAPKDLSVYDSSRSKLAPDTLSPIVNGACDFCNLQTPHQMVIQVASGNSIQKCRGCSRILYVPKASES